MTGVLLANTRGLLPAEDSDEISDAMLNQFLRATKLDAPKAYLPVPPAGCSGTWGPVALAANARVVDRG